MSRRDRIHYLVNGGELARLMQSTQRHTWRIIERAWRDYLVRIAHTNPYDTRLAPHENEVEAALRFYIDKVVIHHAVLESMVKSAWKFPHLETGEALIGVVSPTDPSFFEGEQMSGSVVVYILKTIAPNDSTIREWGTVQMGDEEQFDCFLWLADNWYEDFRDDEFWGRFSLQHLGDWHKHPSKMISPSRGDYQSAREILRDVHWGLPFILQPIITLADGRLVEEASNQEEEFTFYTDPLGRAIRIDFWYLSKSQRSYEKLSHVEVVSANFDDALPGLAPLPWNLLDPQRMDYEEYSLQADGRNYEALYFNTDGVTPLEYCLFLPGSEGKKQILVATPYDYPKRPPVGWILNLKPEIESDGLIEQIREAWPTREVVKPAPDWQWSPKTSISAFIEQIEYCMDLAASFETTEPRRHSE